MQRNKTTLVQLPPTTLGQETKWAYSTMPPSPHDIQMQSSSPLVCPGRERGCLHELHPLRMGDRLRAGIQSRYVASQLGQLSLAYLRFT